MNFSNEFNPIKENDCFDCGDTASIMIYCEGVTTYLCDHCDSCRKNEINDEQPVKPNQVTLHCSIKGEQR